MLFANNCSFCYVVISGVAEHPVAQLLKNLPAKAEDLGLILGLGRSPGEGNGNPLQYSCLENPVDRGAWWATVHGVAKSWTHRVPNTFTLIQPLEWTTSLYPHSQVIQPRAPNDHLHTGF